MAAAENANPIDPAEIDAHREWGQRANQRVWELIGEGRPTDEHRVREAIDAAHASHWHWLFAGGALEDQRGEWLLSHVYALIGDGNAALEHARRCWEITEAEGYADFDRAYACEALARAFAVSGDTAAANEWRTRAAEAGALITDDEDRAIFETDLASG